MLYTVFNLCTSSDTPQSTGLFGSPVTMIVLLVVMFGAMYFLTIRPQKKRQQEEQKLRDSVQIGDDITTIGGITGKIVTSADKTKMEFKRWAIQTNDTANARAAEEKAALEAAKAQEKEEKKGGSRRTRKSDIDDTKK